MFTQLWCLNCENNVHERHTEKKGLSKLPCFFTRHVGDTALVRVRIARSFFVLFAIFVFLVLLILFVLLILLVLVFFVFS
jgi:hypothetical protein